VIKRGIRLDTVGEQLVHEAIVEIEAFRVRRPVAVWKHPRPGDREAIGLGAEILDEADILFIEVIMIVGAIGVGAVLDLAGRVAEGVPDRHPAAILMNGAFDLVGRCRRAPDEAAREAGGRAPVGFRADRTVLRQRGRCHQAKAGKPRELCKVAP
jgi:hypothetical protein